MNKMFLKGQNKQNVIWQYNDELEQKNHKKQHNIHQYQEKVIVPFVDVYP